MSSIPTLRRNEVLHVQRLLRSYISIIRCP